MCQKCILVEAITPSALSPQEMTVEQLLCAFVSLSKEASSRCRALAFRRGSLSFSWWPVLLRYRLAPANSGNWSSCVCGYSGGTTGTAVYSAGRANWVVRAQASKYRKKKKTKAGGATRLTILILKSCDVWIFQEI